MLWVYSGDGHTHNVPPHWALTTGEGGGTGTLLPCSSPQGPHPLVRGGSTQALPYHVFIVKLDTSLGLDLGNRHFTVPGTLKAGFRVKSKFSVLRGAHCPTRHLQIGSQSGGGGVHHPQVPQMCLPHGHIHEGSGVFSS